ncbi:MAG: hypothetical protein WBE34_20055 [Candidatus Nitrosopolaris sp.]
MQSTENLSDEDGTIPTVTIKNPSSLDSIILLTESSTGLIQKIKMTEYFYSTKVLSV